MKSLHHRLERLEASTQARSKPATAPADHWRALLPGDAIGAAYRVQFAHLAPDWTALIRRPEAAPGAR